MMDRFLMNEYAQSALSLGLVALIILVIGWGAKKLISRSKNASDGERVGKITITATTPVDVSRQISLVTFEDRRILVLLGKDNAVVLDKWIAAPAATQGAKTTEHHAAHASKQETSRRDAKAPLIHQAHPSQPQKTTTPHDTRHLYEPTL